MPRGIPNRKKTAKPKSLADQNRDFLSGIIDNIPDTIFVKDAGGRYLISNKSHLKILGMEGAEEITGKTVYDIFPAEYAQKFDRDDKSTIRTGQAIINREELMVDKTGRRHWMSTSKIPIKNADGAVVRLVGISRDITEIKSYQEALRRANVDLESRVEARTADLKRAVAQLREKNRELRRMSGQLASQARMEGELAAARKIQKSMLPAAGPDIPRVRVQSHYQPAFEVGGDYLDYFRSPEGLWTLVIADVCGKGVPAALLMTQLRSAFRMEANGTFTAKELLSRVNTGLSGVLDEYSFITAICLVIEAAGKRMTYARAGHPPLMAMAPGAPPETLSPQGIALGLCPDPLEFSKRMGELALELTPNRRFFLYTDGLIEAMNPHKECYGADRLFTLLGRSTSGDPDLLVQAVVEDVKQFRRGTTMADDLTVLAMTVVE